MSPNFSLRTLDLGLDLKCLDGITFGVGGSALAPLGLGPFESLCERKAPDRHGNHVPPDAVCQIPNRENGNRDSDQCAANAAYD